MGVTTELLETWFRRVWSEEDTSAIAEMFPKMVNLVV